MNYHRIALALVVTASAQDVKEIKLNYDHDVDFSRYKTFGWSVAQQPAKNPANHIRITRAVEEGMAAKGLRKDAAGVPDVFLMYTGKVGETVKVTGRPGGSAWDSTNLRTMVDLNKVREGTLVLEVYDAHSKDVVWRGVVTEVGVQADEMEEAIRAAVKKLLDAYPPKKLEAPKP